MELQLFQQLVEVIDSHLNGVLMENQRGAWLLFRQLEHKTTQKRKQHFYMDMMQCWNGYNQKQFYFTEMSRKNVREILCTFLRFMKNLKGDAMGGRGSSSGMSEKEKPYGSEYETIYKNSNIKFVKIRGNSVTAPMETMTRGRVYVTLDKNNQLKHITYYDNENKRNRQIDLTHVHDGKKPHTHHGYYHDENGTTKLTSEERKMVDRVKRIWYNRNSKK